MTIETGLALLKDVQHGGISPEKALKRLADLPFEDAGFAKIDHFRSLRLGLPEVIFAAGKSVLMSRPNSFRAASIPESESALSAIGR